MEEKIYVIESFIEDLKKDSVKNKTTITRTDEVNIRDALTIEVKNLKDIEPSEYMRVLEVKINAPGRNLFTSKGIDLEAIKFIAKETTNIVLKNQENKAKEVLAANKLENASVKVNSTDGSTQENKEEEAFQISARGYIENTYKDLSNSTKEDFIERMSKARRLKNFVGEQAKKAAERGEAYDVKKAIFDNAEKFGLIPEGAENAIIHLVDMEYLSSEVRTVKDANDIIKRIQDDIVADTLIIGKFKDVFLEAIDEMQQIEAEETKVEQADTEETKDERADAKSSKVSKRKHTGENLVNSIWGRVRYEIVTKSSFDMINYFQDSVKYYDDQIEEGKKLLLDDEKLATLIIKREQMRREIVNETGILAAKDGQKNPLISDDLRSRVIQEFMKTGENVAIIYSKLVQEGVIQRYTNVSCYNLIDIIADELNAQGLSKSDIKAFRENEAQIYEDTIRIQTKEERLAERNNFKSTSREPDAELLSLKADVQKREQDTIKYRRFLLRKSQTFVQSEPTEQNPRDGNEATYQSGIGKKGFVGLFKREKITEQDVVQEQKGIRKIVEYIKSKMPKRKTNTLQDVESPEVDEASPTEKDASIESEIR